MCVSSSGLGLNCSRRCPASLTPCLDVSQMSLTGTSTLSSGLSSLPAIFHASLPVHSSPSPPLSCSLPYESDLYGYSILWLLVGFYQGNHSRRSGQRVEWHQGVYSSGSHRAGYIPLSKASQHTNSKRYRHPSVHSIIYNSQDMEAA